MPGNRMAPPRAEAIGGVMMLKILKDPWTWAQAAVAALSALTAYAVFGKYAAFLVISSMAVGGFMRGVEIKAKARRAGIALPADI